MSIVDKVKEMLGQNAGKARQGVEKAGDMADRKTGGKYSDKIDKAQDQAGKYIDKNESGQGQANRQNEPGDGTPGGGGRPNA
ncbi:antitoxin [Actinomadura yumaensis]|uniref:Antitoxin n=2 Tax=Actinomadura TaxID=1988 RepID=A0ABW2CJC3_9ACTN|nr:antitoxin [Actinomadura sp. J1-007]